MGSGVSPTAAYFTSCMQQNVPIFTVDQLIKANGIVKQLRDINFHIFYRTPSSNPREVIINTFSDASFNICKSMQYGQTVIICGLTFEKGPTNGEDIFHVLHWHSAKQKRVCYSSYGDEILAHADTDDRWFYF